jgi:hypothetical protein
LACHMLLDYPASWLDNLFYDRPSLVHYRTVVMSGYCTGEYGHISLLGLSWQLLKVGLSREFLIWRQNVVLLGMGSARSTTPLRCNS